MPAIIVQQRAASAQSMRAELEPDSPLLAKPSVRKYRTLSYAESPEWSRHNEFILTGYRGELDSWLKCLESVFGYLHNETVNIHSHFHAAIFFVFLLCTVDDKARYDVSWADRFMISIFILSAIFCLSCSAVFHTFKARSKQVAARCLAFDFSGIIVLILGSFYPIIHYGFYCKPHYRIGYSLLLTFAGLTSAYTVLNPKYINPVYRHVRTRFFVSLGLAGFVPMCHSMWFHGIHTATRDMGFFWFLTAIAIYIIGTIIYSNRVPESLCPGRFDIFFSSHQIFHIFVVLAALSTYIGVLAAFDYHHSLEGMCPE
ncbi:hemolysin-III related-domain-containing protein [Lactifluus volemus]|nr:hemolysin-III related-domain-containing protein [Lactifluus volemus]